MLRSFSRLCFTLLPGLLALSASAQTWSVAGDYTNAVNPNGAWSYGVKSAVDSSALCLFNSVSSCPGLATGRHLGSNSNCVSGSCYPYTIPYSSGWLFQHPRNETGIGYNTSRWTAPFSGEFQISASFRNLYGGAIDVSLVLNGVVVPGATAVLTSSGATAGPWTTTALLAVGDTVDLVIGTGGDGDYGDWGEAQATVTTLYACGAGPLLTQQPASSAGILGGNAGFAVAASTLGQSSYQWRKDGSPLSGATQPTFALTALTSTDAGVYDCVVTDFCGLSTSEPAVLTVDDFLLELATPAGPGSFALQISSAPAGSMAFTTFTFDTQNASAPNLGPWSGLWITMPEIANQWLSYSQPCFLFLDANGAGSYALPAGTLAAFPLPVYAVTHAIDPIQQRGVTSSNVAAVALP